MMMDAVSNGDERRGDLRPQDERRRRCDSVERVEGRRGRRPSLRRVWCATSFVIEVINSRTGRVKKLFQN